MILSQGSTTLLLALFNLPGIASSTFFRYLTDNERFAMSAATINYSHLSHGYQPVSLHDVGLTEKGSSALLRFSPSPSVSLLPGTAPRGEVFRTIWIKKLRRTTRQ